ncbi:MAG: serine hydroxymethyltransferase [Elusimicrobia bacterium]|nr:serine hydroxymethyltransferase [Elusimicrobiota bacterium]
MYEELKKADSEVYEAVRGEVLRQQNKLELIASENYASKAVLEALGSVLTNKYAEGYPGKRYYGGCEFVDIAEQTAIDRAKQLFNAEHANVQPHSGTQANITVYTSLIKPGDTIMGLNLSHGGHLSHGHPLNFSGKYFNVVAFSVRQDTETINFEEVRKLARDRKPKLILAGASNYSRVFDWKQFKEIADSAGAFLVCDIAHYAGLIAAGIYPSPVPFADVVTSTTHKTLRGPRGGFILSKAAHSKEIDKNNFPGNQGGPLMHAIAAKAVCFGEALKPEFKTYQEQVLKNARAMAKELASMGYRIVSGGTDCHMFSVDLRPKNATGKEAEAVLDKAGITVNKNTIPYDPQKPMVTSGIRIGTPAVTTRGMKEKEMAEIAAYIDEALSGRDNEKVLKDIADKVKKFCSGFPIYAGFENYCFGSSRASNTGERL